MILVAHCLWPDVRQAEPVSFGRILPQVVGLGRFHASQPLDSQSAVKGSDLS